jgi:hypothetical protein
VKFEKLSTAVFLYSLSLTKILVSKLKSSYTFERGEFLFVYAGALILSVKLADDGQLWFLEDLAAVTDICADLLANMELFVLCDALNFDIRIMQDVL